MAFRSMNHWKQMMNRFGSYSTSTSPKMKAYTPTVGFAEQNQLSGKRPLRGDAVQNQLSGKRPLRGDAVPVYVAVGMITVALALGLHTAKQHLMHDPQVYVKKQRRETLPEVMEPDHVVEEAEKLLKKSFLRKVAHVQEFDKAIPDPIRRDAFAHRPKALTLKSVGVDPKAAAAVDPKA